MASKRMVKATPQTKDRNIFILRGSVLRFPSTNLAGLEIDFVEAGFVEIPESLQFSTSNRAGSEVWFIFGRNIQQQLVVFEFKTLHV